MRMGSARNSDSFADLRGCLMAFCAIRLCSSTRETAASFRTESDAMHTELTMQRLGIISNYIESATLCRALGTKSANDDIAATPDCTCDLPYVCSTVIR